MAVVLNSGFYFKNCRFSNANLFDRGAQGKDNLIFVQFISESFRPSPNMLYFGEKTIQELAALTGQMVDVYLEPSAKGFNVKDIRPIQK